MVRKNEVLLYLISVVDFVLTINRVIEP